MSDPRPPALQAPLSFGQERLWFLDQLEPGGAVYNETIALRLEGALQEESLAGALRTMIRRHEVLRTTYGVVRGEPVQQVAPAIPLPLQRVDLIAVPAAETEGLRLLTEEAGRPFDLERGPLFRVLLVRVSAREHFFLITIHHSIFDAATFEILLRELSALYRELSAGRAPALPELPAQYRDFAVWQRQRQAAQRTAEQLAHWRRRLAGLEDLALPADRSRPARPGYDGGRLYFSLPEVPLEPLAEVGRLHGASPFMVLLAAFFELLYRYTGRHDLAVGTTVSLRNRRDFENLIGFFINTLVLRVERSGDPTFRELVEGARGTTLEAIDNQEVPFEKLVEELRPERSPGFQPLVRTMFMVQPALRRARRLGELPATLLDVYNGTAKFDLLVHLYLGPGELGGGIEYSRDLFDGATIDRLVGHFSNLLIGAGREPDRPSSDLPLLGTAERQQLVAEWCGRGWERPRGLTVHGLFAEQAQRCPEAIAVVGGERRLTYRQLAGAADELARRLRSLGVGPEILVGVCAERSPEMIAALLAILQAGGAYLPLDPGHPPDRLAFMLRDSGAPLVLVAGAVAGRLPEVPGVARVPLESAGAPGNWNGPAPAGEAGGANLAYVMYTSGSTGRPKGVAVPHEGIVRLVRETDYVRFEGEVFLQLAPVSFDASTLEIWGPLLNGGRLVLFPQGVPTAGSLAAALADHQVSVLWLTAGLFHLVAAENVAALAPVRQLLAGGDVLSVPAVRRVIEELPATRLINGYGPTENTTFTCCHPVVDLPRERVPIGRPIAGTRVHVLNAEMRPVPVGVPGELFAGGRGLARGYLRRPDLTAERFVPDPLELEPGGRLYRTGDRARFLPGGALEFLGRIDQQIKVRGFRVEPGEIEAVLAEHPSVSQALVLAPESEPGGERRLIAYVAGAGEARPEPAALRSFLAARLPDSMMPSLFVVLDELPLTPNGKIDWRRLPAPEAERPEGDELVAPRTPTEELLAEAWSRLLGIDRVGVHESFFELGGHSLLAARLVGWLREACAVELPVRALFESPTLAGLAERIDALRREGGQAEMPPVVPAARGGEGFPLSFAQERLWFLERLQPGGSAYNVAFSLRLRGRLDPGFLAASLGEIVRRHEALRTVFRVCDDQVLQIVLSSQPLPLPLIDLRGAFQGTAEAVATEEATRPFDLSAGPLLRTVLLRLGEEEHALFLTLHHIVADGWSIRILLDELEILYAASAGGAPSSLPELAVQYPDFAVWQRRWLAGGVLESQLAFWRDRLQGAPPLDLPTDRPRPPVETLRGATRVFSLPARLLAGLERLGRQQGATLFMTLLAAFDVLLARYSGQEDFCVGTPIASRPRPEIEPLIGLFLNTLALRADLAGDPSFLSLLERVRETALAAYAHQDIPFERLVEEIQPERDLRRAPLFQTMLSVQGGILETRRLGDTRLTVEPLETGASRFDLTLSLSESGGLLYGWLEHSTDLFDEATIIRMVLHFERLLEGAVAAPEARVSELPLLSEADRHQLLDEWNDTWTEPAACLHELFEEHARRRPEAVAVAGLGRMLSYGELERRAGALAAELRGRGVGPEVVVAVQMRRSPEMVVALLGILTAGGAYLPLDPAAPPLRVASILAESGAPLLLGESDLTASLREVLPAGGPQLMVVGEELSGRSLKAGAGAGGAAPAGAGNLAYVIYTSGSTGRPKGVAVSRGSLANLVKWHRERYAVTPSDRATLLANPSFDASVWEIWPYLAAGASLWIPEEETAQSPAHLVDWLAAERIDLSFLPTPLAQAALEESWPAATRLRALLTGGDRLLRARWSAPFALHNHYGPTESTVVATVAQVVPAAAGAPAIGRPLPGTQAYVLDAGMAAQPLGVPGELYLGGAGLARGYLGRAEATAERFVPNPFASELGARLYRTGDLVRWRATGELEFLGRLDHQVKVRGFRIELGEIEAVLASHPAVREAVVVAPRVEGFRDRLAAYVIPAGEPVPRAEELEAFLLLRLPGFMVPQAVMILESFPRTPSGKIDRRSLPVPEWAGAGAAGPSGLRTPLEELVSGIWCEVLRVERIGPADDFFALGGHSLLAAQLASRVRRTLGVDLPIRDVFEAPTVPALASRIEALRRGEEGLNPPPPIVPLDRSSGELPLSFAQERLWFLDQVLPDGSVYNIPALFWIHGPLDPAVLAASLGAIVRRHEVLRSAIEYRDDRLVQRVSAPVDLPLPVLDLEGTCGRAAALDLAEREARRPFELARGPLLRALLMRLGDGEHALLLTLHHIVADGGSLQVIAAELAAFYPALRDGRPARVPDLPVQYGDFAAWQRQWLSGETLERQLAYWRERLAGAVPLDLPADHPRPSVRTYRGATDRFILPPSLRDGLERLGRERGATLFMTLLAAFSALLARWSGQDDLSIGTPVANRMRPELEPLVGLFVNTLVLRADLAGDPTFAELLVRARESALGAYMHQDVPFERLVAELQPGRDPSRTPLFQVMLALQDASIRRFALGGLQVETEVLAGEVSRFDLTLSLAAGDEGLAGWLEYSSDLFDRTTIERLIGHFSRLLTGVGHEPDRPLPELSFLGESERRQLIEWSGRGWERPRGLTIHGVFAEQARRSPEAVAVAWGEACLTYRQLDEAAEEQARRLRSLGVGPEVLVGVCAERSPELIAALLGILRAGGAYLPLDPGHPPERLAFMLRDGGASLVLVDAATEGRLPRMAGVERVPLGGLGSAAALRDGSGEDPAGEEAGARLAYVMYTSGSTGRPKGVAVPHEAVVRLVRETDYLHFDGAVFLQLAPVSFDASTLEIWGALLNGCRLVLFPGHLPTVETLAAVLSAHQVSVLWLTAGLFHLVVSEDVRALAPVRQLLAGGDVLAVPAVRRVLADLPATRLINGYGPTENTTFTCCHEVVEIAGERVPIGRPIAGTRVHVLDGQMRLVPVGVPGELFAGGRGLARGYLGRPDLTADRFVPDPLGLEPGGRLYRTGDRVRHLPGGTLEFLGRIDDQVKVRGFRVEPGEVEAVLTEHPSVSQALVTAPQSVPGGERRLVAYVTGAGEARPEPAGLRSFLAARLPDSMVPSLFVILDEFPLTPNGKVDRRRLPAPEVERTEGDGFVAPRSQLEAALAGIWSEVLGVERIGVHDDFFALGGHSLMAARIVSRVRRRLGVEVPIATLFERSTLAELADSVVREEARQASADELGGLLETLSGLSEEEVLQQLAAHTSEAG